MSRIDDLIEVLCPKGVEFRELGTLGKRNKGTPMTASKMKLIGASGGPVRVFGGGQTIADVSEDDVPAKDVVRVPSIIVKSRGYIGFTYYDRPFTHKTELWSYTINDACANQRFVYYYLLTQAARLQEIARATSVKIPQLGVKDTDTLRIPVPPLEVQREIVRILDQFTQLEAELESELEARRRQYEHYRRTAMAPASHWTTERLGDVVDFQNAKAHERLVDPDGDVTLLTAGFISAGSAKARFVRSEDVLTPARLDDVALVMSDLPNGRALARAFFVEKNDKFAANQRVCLLRPISPNHLDAKFLYYTIDRNSQLLAYDSGVDQTHLKKDWILNIQIGIPPVEEQRKIAKMLDKFDSLVNDLSVGLPAELAARRKQYEYYRDLLLTFEEAVA